MITDNQELRQKFNEIIDLILKMCHRLYKRRPTCAELLSEYSKWGIDDSVIINLDDYEVTNELVKINKFFDYYLKSKLNL